MNAYRMIVTDFCSATPERAVTYHATDDTEALQIACVALVSSRTFASCGVIITVKDHEDKQIGRLTSETE